MLVTLRNQRLIIQKANILCISFKTDAKFELYVYNI